ncbi:disulfide bond formation protein B [Pelagibacteraceae bacterium]|nr:disulfide bond formation protein B [Pelagibacteraceae bacterium]
MTSKDKKHILNGILIFSILCLSIAYFIQYVLGHKPCNLCLIERIPYLASIIIISLTFVINKFEKLIFLAVGLLFIFGAMISFYHYGIEQGFFSESLICKLGNDNTTTSTQDLLKQLEKKTISCKNVTFEIFGITLAGINFIISLTIAFLTLRIHRNYEKR